MYRWGCTQGVGYMPGVLTYVGSLVGLYTFLVGSPFLVFYIVFRGLVLTGVALAGTVFVGVVVSNIFEDSIMSYPSLATPVVV